MSPALKQWDPNTSSWQIVSAPGAQALADETTNRINADLTLQGNIDAFKPGSTTWLKANVNNLTYTSVTRDANGAATSATVVWPDGTGGTYTADTVSTAFPGAVDAYHVTYTGSPTKTVTQAAVTRDATTGAVTAQPALVVS